MKHVVITGSTRGIGYGLAKQFLELGYKVTINGTTTEGVKKALGELQQQYPSAKVQGFVGRVEVYHEVEELWHNAYSKFGNIDIWINNAGIGQARKYSWEMTAEDIKKIVDINVLGLMNGSNIALKKMRQQGQGAIYNMEGFGSDGMMMDRMTYYGATKRALRYFTRSMAKEMKNSPILIGTLNPGMVLTDLLLHSVRENKEDAEKIKKVFNILADDVETVTKFLVEGIVKNKKNGAHIIWLTKTKLAFRFMFSPFNKKDFFKGE